MRRIVRSEGYARARLVSGVAFAFFGVVIFARMLATGGSVLQKMPGLVLGVALVALAFFRFYEYAAAKRRLS